MDNSLKAIFINLNSIVSRYKRHCLSLFLTEHKPDIVLLAEHCLSQHHKFDMRGYLTFRQDRHNGRGRGTAVLVRENLKCEEIVVDTGAMENTSVRIRKVNGNDIVVIAMYLRPGTNLETEDFDAVQRLSQTYSIIIGADLNSRHPYWGDTYTNVSGRNLYEFLLTSPDFDIRQTDGPTRINPVISSYIDFFLTTVDVIPTTNRLRTIDYDSDHKAVEFSFLTSQCQQQEPVIRYDFDRINVRNFRNRLSTNLENLSLPVDRNVTQGEIDQCIENMNGAFMNAIEHSVPKINAKGRGLLNLPPHILNFINTKKRLRRTLHRCGDPGRCNVLKAEIKNLNTIIQGAIYKFETDYWTDFLSRIKVNNKTYRKVKTAAGLNARSRVQALNGSNGLLVTDDIGKANLLAETFQMTQSAQPNAYDTEVRELVSTLDRVTPMTTFGHIVDERTIYADRKNEELGFIDAAAIGTALKRRSNKKSSGTDGIPDFILRKTDTTAWNFLAILFNHCVNLGYFPRSWKSALIIPILKPRSDPSSTGNYRPISLLSAIGKLFEFFILEKIKEIILEKNILTDCQFGFRAGHSTSHALMVFTNYVAKGLNNKCPTIAVSLDFSKAFDTVWHDGILFKLQTMGFEIGICRLISSFLEDRKFCVKVGNAISEESEISAGVPQGSLLGPVLYNIYVSDIPQPPEGDLLLMYADDILIASSGARARLVNNRINCYLANLSEYFLKWKFSLNMGKTVSMIFKGKRKNIYRNCRSYIPSLSIGGEIISISDRMTYLGVTFHEKFEYYRHIDDILQKAKKIYSAYKGILRRKEGLDQKVRLLLYRQVIRPIVSYAFPSWFGISSSQMERLRRWERGVLVACLGLRPHVALNGVVRRPSCGAIYTAIDFKRIDRFMVDSAVKFLESSQNLDNSLVRECFAGAGNLEAVQNAKYFSPVDLLTLKGAGILYIGDKLLFYHRRINTLNVNDTVYITTQ